MKKVIAAILVVIVIVGCLSAFVACGGKKAAPNFVVPEGGYDGSDVTIKFDHTMGSNLRDVLDIYIAEFNEIYPNIHIVHEQVGSYNDVRNQIMTQLPAGNEPNIAYCYPDHVALFNLSGRVATLDTLIESAESDGLDGALGLTQEQIDDFVPAYYNEGRQFGDGLMYSMPFLKSTEVLYYNKTFFEANNIPVPKTWFVEDEDLENGIYSMETVCQMIKAVDPTSIPLGYDSEANWFITMCEQYGSGYTDASSANPFKFDNETNRNFVAKLKTWYQNTWATTQTIYGAYTSGLFVEQNTEKSRSYMSIGSSAGATHQRPEKVGDAYPFEVGIAPIPQVDQNRPKVISQGPSVCIFKKDNPQEVVASWLFVKFLTTSKGFQAAFSMKSGYVPVIKSVVDYEAEDFDDDGQIIIVKPYQNFLDSADGGDHIAALSASVCVGQVDAYYTSPAFNGSSTARDEVNALLVAAISGEKSIADAFADAMAKCLYALD